MGFMFHGFTYPDEAEREEEKNKLTARFFNPLMKKGIITFPTYPAGFHSTQNAPAPDIPHPKDKCKSTGYSLRHSLSEKPEILCRTTDFRREGGAWKKRTVSYFR